MSRNIPEQVILVESSPGDKRGLSLFFIPLDRFGDKGILVCDGLMLVSRTPLYVFDAGTVNSQRCRDEIMEA
ncbi:hypothetical protein TNCV_4525241 [Trichonephila clavipes]|nr:hypothetical protein TNCV_4525241 [Trichonephila clavipes]